MRLVIDSLVAVMLAAVLGGVIVHNRERDERALAVEETRQAVRQIEQQLNLQIALEQVELNDQGHPRTVDPAWFHLGLPQNQLLDVTRPWVEVAAPEDRDLLHPVQIEADDKSIAAFWYNPYQGVVRARVPDHISDQATLDLYNQANGTKLADLYAR